MITDLGQRQLLKLIAGNQHRFADMFVVGISSATLPTSATALDFGWAAVNVTGSYVDEALNQVVFYGTIDSDLAGDIKEVGLVALNDEFVKSGLPNSIVYSFDSSEPWFTDGSFVISAESSIGTGNYRYENVAEDVYLGQLLSAVSIVNYDTFKIKVNSNQVTEITVQLKNDDTNYIHKDLTLASGDNLLSNTIASFTTVGTFNPNLVNEIRIIIKTVTSGTNHIEFDAATLSGSLNGALVARDVLAVTMYKRQGSSMEIEYAVEM